MLACLVFNLGVCVPSSDLRSLFGHEQFPNVPYPRILPVKPPNEWLYLGAIATSAQLSLLYLFLGTLLPSELLFRRLLAPLRI